MQGDFTRLLKQINYLVTGTNGQTIGWDSKDEFPPYDGQLRLDVYTHLSSGANRFSGRRLSKGRCTGSDLIDQLTAG
jgi:hypothetical protein